MKRYEHDDDEFQDENLFPDTDYDDDDDDDDGDDGEEIIMDSAEYAELMRRQEALALMQLGLSEFNLNQRLLFKAMELVKKNTWFFSFRSKETQLKMIGQTYRFLKDLIVQQNEEKDA